MTRLRVVSLVPSATETLLVWGVTPLAVTRFCEQPDLPHVGGTKDPDVAAIVALAPDLVVVCEEENRAEDAAALRAEGLDLFVFRIDAIEDVAPQLGLLADRLDLDVRVPHDDGPDAASRARAFVPVWRRPWMTLSPGTYGASILRRLGIDVVPRGRPERYPEVTLDEVRRCAPDLVVAPSEPYPFAERHRTELETVAPVVLVDGKDLFWWGVRTPTAISRLAAQVRDTLVG